MTIITIAIVVAIAAIVFGIFFIPGVGSALAMGLGTAFFRVLGENRQKRVALRQERWRLRRGREPAPEVEPGDAPEVTPEVAPEVKPDSPPLDPVEADRRVRRLQRWRRRGE